MAEPGLVTTLKEKWKVVAGVLVVLLLLLILLAVLIGGDPVDPEEKPLQMPIYKTPEKGKQLSLDEDILSIDGIMQRLDQLDAEKGEVNPEIKATIRENLELALTNFLDHERATETSRYKLPHSQTNFETDRRAFKSRLLLAIQNSISVAETRMNGWNSVAMDELLEEMRRACDGGQSIEILDESCDEDDDLDKILALSTPFRRIDGWCNNLKEKSWGGAGTAFRRLAPNAYDDRISKPRNVPISPREVSNGMHAANSEFSSVEANANASERVGPLSTTHTSHMHMQFGQFLDHDISITPEAELDCCNEAFLAQDKKSRNPRCFNVPVTKRNFLGHSCFSFTRSDTTCRGWKKPVEQMNGLTAFIDGSQIYGSDKRTSLGLRDQKRFGKFVFSSASLKTHDRFRSENLPRRAQCGFPIHEPQIADGLTAGDVRVTIQPTLASIQTLFLREHNRIVKGLRPIVLRELFKLKNFEFLRHSEELVFQIARQLVGAQLQNIVYREYLPIVLGKEAHGNMGSTDTKYDPTVDPSVLNEFATVAFRYGHSQVLRVFQGVSRWSLEFLFFDRDGDRFVTGNLTAGEREGTNWMHEMGGSSAQKAAASDLPVVDDLRNKLFFNINGGVPDDLVSRNIQRARDHGIPSYGVLREACGMSSLTSSGAPPEISDDTWARLMRVYKGNPRHIDPFTGGLAEKTPEDGSVGPLFACIIKKQFENLRDGDRYFFTHRSDSANSVRSLGQVAKKDVLERGLASVLCDNVDKDILSMHQVGQLPFKAEPELKPVKATMSSTFKNNDHFRADKCIDGNTRGPDVGVSDGEAVDLCHTAVEPKPWLAIDFGSGAAVRRVEIFNRIDCCAERTRNIEVRVSNELPTSGQQMFTGGRLLGNFAGPAEKGQKISILGQRTLTGRFVIVQMDNGQDELNLKEVKAFREFERIDCARTHEFNFDGIVTEAFEALGVGKAGAESGKIESPGHPRNYPNNRDKTYNLEVESGSAIELTFERFELERPHSRRGCIWDWVEVIDGDGTILMRKSCGGSKSEISGGISEIGGSIGGFHRRVTSRTSKMAVEFHSDRGVTGPGFSATWKKVPSRTAFTPPQNQVTSPNYPFNYPNNVFSEEIEIGSPDGSGLQLTFNDFVLEHSEGCSFDFVQVLDKSSGVSSDKLCGSELPGPITSTGNMTILFHSDSSDRFRGFRATWTPV